MRAFLRGWLLPALACVLTGPAQADDPAAAPSTAGLLVYRVQERGADPYFSRILVTDSHLRMDYGTTADGFILLDRTRKILYSVNDRERTLLVIDPERDKPESPVLLALSETRQEDPKAPPISGVRPVHYTLRTNGQVCSHLVAVSGVMTRALAGLREYLELLSFQQAAAVPATPGELQNPCDLARHVYFPAREIDLGLPVRSWNEAEQRELVDFREDFPVTPGLFELPAGYERLTLPGASRENGQAAE